jgi:hypothetical protein
VIPVPLERRDSSRLEQRETFSQARSGEGLADGTRALGEMSPPFTVHWHHPPTSQNPRRAHELVAGEGEEGVEPSRSCAAAEEHGDVDRTEVVGYLLNRAQRRVVTADVHRRHTVSAHHEADDGAGRILHAVGTMDGGDGRDDKT